MVKVAVVSQGSKCTSVSCLLTLFLLGSRVLTPTVALLPIGPPVRVRV